MSDKAKDKTMTGEEKRGLIPRLRFPEFRGAGEWNIVLLSHLAKRCIQKNRALNINRVLTNSAEFGVVDQHEFFDKDIANQDNLRGYLVVEKGDYIYNPRVSNLAPVGPISRNSIAKGIISPLYTIFRFKNTRNDFYKHFFATTGWHKYIRQASSTGARHDRMAISSDAFMAMPLPSSSQEEQQKIADCLSSIDELITSEAQYLDTLKTHKKGLMQQLFPEEGETVPRLRFPEFREAGDWEEKRLGEVAEVLQGYGFPEQYQGNAYGEYPFYKVSDISNALQNGERCITKSANYINSATLRTLKAKFIPAGATIFAKIGEAIRGNRRALTTMACVIDNNVAAVKVFDGKSTDWFIYYVLSGVSLADYAGGVVPAVNKSSIENIEIICPRMAEQQKIADCLSSIDELITAEAQYLDTLKTHKNGLMQQMFPAPGDTAE